MKVPTGPFIIIKLTNESELKIRFVKTKCMLGDKKSRHLMKNIRMSPSQFGVRASPEHKKSSQVRELATMTDDTQNEKIIIPITKIKIQETKTQK